MKQRCSTSPRWPGLALVGALAAADFAGRRRRAAAAGRRAARSPRAGRPDAGGTGRRPGDPGDPGCSRRTRRAGGPGRCTLPAPTRAIVPVAASSVAAKPDQWLGEYVAMTGVVDTSLGRMAFSVDQDKTKSGSDVLVLAHRMSDPVAVNTYVTVIGLLMKYDPAEVAGKSKVHAQDLPADAVAKVPRAARWCWPPRS